MLRTKKIYKYVNQLVEPCKWCDGTGWNLKSFTNKRCFICKGSGGEWKQIRELVGEEVTE